MRSISKFKLLPLILMSAVAGESQSIGGSDVGQTPTGVTADQAATAAAEARKRSAAANFLPIVRGRLPLIFVHALRFDPTLLALSSKDAASKFATSVGKVFDIRKNKNFEYVTAEFKPSAEDVTAAEQFISQIGTQNVKGQAATGDKDLLQKTLDGYKERGLASPEEIAKFSAARTKTRAPSAPKQAATGETPATTATDTAVQPTVAGSADDLLA